MTSGSRRLALPSLDQLSIILMYGLMGWIPAMTMGYVESQVCHAAKSSLSAELVTRTV